MGDKDTAASFAAARLEEEGKERKCALSISLNLGLSFRGQCQAGYGVVEIAALEASCCILNCIHHEAAAAA